MALLVFKPDLLLLSVVVHYPVPGFLLPLVKSMARVHILIDKLVHRHKAIVVSIKHLKQVIDNGVELQLVRNAFADEKVPQLFP